MINCQSSYEICIQGRTQLLTRTTTIMKKKVIVGFNNVLMNKHWSLFFADTERRLIYYLDSLSDNANENKKVLRKWVNFIKSRKVYITGEWQLGLFEYTKQTDSINCGVICLKFLETLIQGIMDKEKEPQINMA